MPGPPPYGVSSTVRCTSSVQRAQVVHAELDLAALDRLAEQRLPQRRQVVREDRDDVDVSQRGRLIARTARRAGRSTTMPAGEVDRRHDRRDERHQQLGARRRRAPGRLPPPACRTSVTGPSSAPSTVRAGEADQVGVVELVRILDRRPVGGRDQQQRCRAAPRRRRGRRPPAKCTTSLPLAAASPATVSGPRSAGSVRSTEPAANRSSGSSVHGSTNTSPRTPRGRPIRPTAIELVAGRPARPRARGQRPVDVDDVDPDALAADAVDHLAQRLGGAAVAADHPAQVVGVHPDLQPLAAAVVDQVDHDVVRVVDDAADQVLEGLLEHVSSPPRRGLGGASAEPRPAAASVGSAAGLGSWRLGGRLGLLRRGLLARRGGRRLVGSPSESSASAALNSACLSGFGLGHLHRRAAPARP